MTEPRDVEIAAATAVIRGGVCATSGVRVDKVEISEITTKNGTAGVRVAAGVLGWGPALHEQRMEWRATLATTLATRGGVGCAALTAWRARMDIQQARLDRGIALGRSTPFRSADGIMPCGHMRIDRGLVRLMDAARGTSRLDEIVGRALHDLSRMPVDGKDDSVVNDDGIHGDEFRRMLRVGEAAGGLCYDGETLWVGDGGIPDTVRTAMVGRRLGDLVEVPAEIAAARVLRIEDGDDGADEIHLERDLVRIADYIEGRER